MGKPALKPQMTVGDLLTKGSKPAKPAKEKQKAVGFFNYEATTPDGKTIVLKSSKGFSIYDNEYMTREERALIELAKQNDGHVVIENCRIRIVLNQDKPEIDLSNLSLVTKD